MASVNFSRRTAMRLLMGLTVDDFKAHLETMLTQPICGPTTLDTTVESIPGFHFENCTVTININKE